MIQTAQTPGTSPLLLLISWMLLCACAPGKVTVSKFIPHHPCTESCAVQYLCALITIGLSFKQWELGNFKDTSSTSIQMASFLSFYCTGMKWKYFAFAGTLDEKLPILVSLYYTGHSAVVTCVYTLLMHYCSNLCVQKSHLTLGNFRCGRVSSLGVCELGFVSHKVENIR